jgi:hypothetical protein
VAGSLNLILFWGWVLWLHFHYTTEAWKMQEHFLGIARYLILVTIAGGAFGEGRVQVTVCIAGILGFFLWLPTGFGVL